MRLVALFLWSMLMLVNWGCGNTDPNDLDSRASYNKEQDKEESDAKDAIPPKGEPAPPPPSVSPPPALLPPASGPFVPSLAGIPFGERHNDRGERHHNRFCEDSLGPVCDGECPAGQTCIDSDGSCVCIGDPCTDTPAPTCGGVCPSGQQCNDVDGHCICQTPCANSVAPTCGGICPTGQECNNVDSSCI